MIAFVLGDGNKQFPRRMRLRLGLILTFQIRWNMDGGASEKCQFSWRCKLRSWVYLCLL